MTDTKFFTYKGYPLVRSDKTIYYGCMGDKYVALLTIISTYTVKDIEVAEKVNVKLMQTAKDVDLSEMVVKNCDRVGLYEALDIANIWLNKMNNE